MTSARALQFVQSFVAVMSNSSASDAATRSSTSTALCWTFCDSDGYVSPSSSRGW
jgi:hypothetical protein